MDGGRVLHRGRSDDEFLDGGLVRAARLRLRRAAAVHVGAVGTPAKAITEREAVRPGFPSGVIGRRLLKAPRGEDSVILCSTAMFGHVRGRVAEFETRTFRSTSGTRSRAPEGEINPAHSSLFAVIVRCRIRRHG